MTFYITCIESNTSKHLCKIFSSSVFDMICWAIDLTVEHFSVKLQCTKSHHILSQYYFSKSQHHWHGIFNVALLLMKIVNVEDTFSKTWKCSLSLVTLHSKCFYWCHILFNTIKTLLHYVPTNSIRRQAQRSGIFTHTKVS